MKTWYLKFPVSKYYEADIKRQAAIAKARIIDARFQGDEKSAEDCPLAKGEEKPVEEAPKEEVKEEPKPEETKEEAPAEEKPKEE